MKKSKVKIYEKLLRKDIDFDYSCLLDLEQFKLKRMIDSFEHASCPYVGIENHIREMKICVSLIDIILERDAYMNTYMEDNYGKNGIVQVYTEGNEIKTRMTQEHYKIPVHVNTKNYARFRFNKEPDELILMEFRRVKAMYLYNKIRNRMFHWWW